ncbi:MAG TPA: hypothetical protein VII30_07650, partial [Gemmatimonadaceae bacterium]
MSSTLLFRVRCAACVGGIQIDDLDWEGGAGVLAGDVQGRAQGDPRLSGAKERSEGLRPASAGAREAGSMPKRTP